MIEFNQTEIREYYAARIPGSYLTNQRKWRAPCPVHRGKDPNFEINSETGTAYCHSRCKKGFDVLSLEMELSGMPFAKCKREVFKLVGREEPARDEADIHAVYNYTDEHGEVLYQVVRKSGKKFMQRRPMSEGRWAWGLESVEAVPYNLKALKDAEFCCVVEGERDSDNLTRAGILATCNNGGAGHFKPELVKWFTGKRVMILADNDEPGRAHALKVAKMLAPVVDVARIVELPDLPEKGDVSDFLARGGTVEEILDLYERAENWTPEWKFLTTVPNENDRYVFTIPQYIEHCGGLQKFWDLEGQEGISTPFVTLTKALGGLQDGEVYILGGNQGSGKTSLVLQFMIKALRDRVGTLLFSMEMQHRNVFQRMAAIEARVDLSEYREYQKAKSTCDEYKYMRLALNSALEELMDLPLLVSTKSSVTPQYLMAETERLRGRQRINLVAVDHMQLMSASTSVKGDYEKFTAISRSCKQIAMELKVPVLIVSQTNRSNTTDKRTELEVSDLRGCLDGGSLVLLADGRRKPISAIQPGEAILGMGIDQKMATGIVERAWSTGTHTTYKIRTRFGREIVATPNHPFRVPSGWKALSQLAVGDDIAGVLRAAVGSDVLWDVIESIEPAGRVETWDMRVPGIHNFTANDFVVHNSGALEEDAAAVLLVYPDKDSRDNAVKSGTFSTGPLKTWLKIGKNRYGEQGKYLPLMHFKKCTRFDSMSAEVHGVDY